MFYKPCLQPSGEPEAGANFEPIDSFDRPKLSKPARLRESKVCVSPAEEEPFDDTFKMTEARRMREGEGCFSRGVPTNDETSSTNYSGDLVKIIDGEHKSLLSLGKINEAMEDDPHPFHMRSHRLQLSNPDLTETQRGALMEHISDHSKKHSKKLKAVSEATEEAKGAAYNQPAAPRNRAKAPTTYDVIPQDDEQSAARKRTAGMVSMEAQRAQRSKRFQRFKLAVRKSFGRSL